MERFEDAYPSDKQRLDELNAGDRSIPRRVSIAIPRSRDWTNIIHFAVLYFLLLYFFIISNPHGQRPFTRNLITPVDMWSPAQEAVKYKQVPFEKHFLNRSPWTGVPTKELDAKWLSLYDFGVTGISAEEAARLEDSTAKMPHNDSYAISLEVFHQLHCLDHLQKSLYPDRYPDLWRYNPNHTVDHDTFKALHWDHCIDLLRQTLMCHGDITPVPFVYKREIDSVHPAMKSTHMCRDYSKIQEWAAARQDKTVDKSNMAAMEEMVEAISGDGD
ncbi:hypothetical protein B7463_g1173, partial [Scytalidium lignicola]